MGKTEAKNASESIKKKTFRGQTGKSRRGQTDLLVQQVYW